MKTDHPRKFFRPKYPFAMAGYSGTPLAKKLGIKAESKVVLLDAPDGLRLPGVTGAASGVGDVTLLFVIAAKQLEKLKGLRGKMPQDGCVWACWPKKASGVVTDVGENLVRDVALASGLVDVKVCAVDEVWSGLKLVIRVKDRN